MTILQVFVMIPQKQLLINLSIPHGSQTIPIPPEKKLHKAPTLQGTNSFAPL